MKIFNKLAITFTTALTMLATALPGITASADNIPTKITKKNNSYFLEFNDRKSTKGSPRTN